MRGVAVLCLIAPMPIPRPLPLRTGRIGFSRFPLHSTVHLLSGSPPMSVLLQGELLLRVQVPFVLCRLLRLPMMSLLLTMCKLSMPPMCMLTSKLMPMLPSMLVISMLMLVSALLLTVRLPMLLAMLLLPMLLLSILLLSILLLTILLLSILVLSVLVLPMLLLSLLLTVAGDAVLRMRVSPKLVMLELIFLLIHMW